MEVGVGVGGWSISSPLGQGLPSFTKTGTATLLGDPADCPTGKRVNNALINQHLRQHLYESISQSICMHPNQKYLLYFKVL